jgi:hypothetical protein
MRSFSGLTLAVVAIGLLAGCSQRGAHTSEYGVTAAATIAPTLSPVAQSLAPSPFGTSISQTLTPTATPTPEEAVLAAYDKYWDVYSLAAFTLDPSPVPSVAAGDELQSIQEEIDGLRAKGVALNVRVKRTPLVVQVSENSATVYDEIVNNSFYVDAKTKQPPQASGNGEILRDTFYFQELDGAWKVVRSTRQQ